MREIFRNVFKSPYFKWFMILSLLYIIFSYFGNLLSRFDFILLCYIVLLPNIDEDNALPYAILFGLYYDLYNQIYLGLGVLLFQMLNFIKIQMYLMVDMSKLHMKILFYVSIITIYLMLTLKFYSYSYSYWQALLYYMLTNLSLISVIYLIRGGKYALSRY